jgi:hypothetical protein
MKNKHLLLSAAILLSAGVFAQDKNISSSKVPPQAVKAFEKAFPGASKAKWEKEGADYEVNFVEKSKEMSAVFDAGGTWKETEEEIKVSELPANVKEYIKKNYNASPKEAAKITKDKGVINYEAEVNHKDILFDANGNFIKAE